MGLDETHRLPGACADAVIEATGSAEVIEEGLRLLRPGARYEWVGMVHPKSALTMVGETIVRDAQYVAFKRF